MQLFVLCLLSFVALSVATPTPHSRGCIYVLGRCYRECEEGTHAYAIGCGQKMPEATCEQPRPVLEQGTICDYSACYCDSPNVRHTKSGKCMKLEECPEKE